jgi:hypothetical protein
MHLRTLGLTLSFVLIAEANLAEAAEPPLAAPSGFQGAGLGMGEQKGRAWLETAFHTQEQYTVLGTTLGGGYRVTDSLELEAMLPFEYSSIDVENFSPGRPTTFERETAFRIGNPYLGISRVHLDGTVRYKAGLGVTLPLATADSQFYRSWPVPLTATTYGWQDLHLWAPNTLSVAAPMRVEVGDTVVASVDATPIVTIVTEDNGDGDDADLLLQAAPGVGVYAGDALLLGVRLPIAWLATVDTWDAAQVALEPYARLDLGGGFVNARLTVNLDEPYGYAFKEGKVWGAHLGGGLVF